LKKRVTIYDVARESGVSVATVSRVVNNVEYSISPKLREEVINAVAKLEYKQNLVGKCLRSNQNNDIGVIIPNMSNYYYIMLMSAINDGILGSDYNVLLSTTSRNPQNEKKVLTSLLQKMVKKIIIAVSSDNINWLKDIDLSGIDIVAIEHKLDIKCNNIGFNYKEGAKLAIKHLVEMGHKKIAFISSPISYASRIERYNGVIESFEDYNIEIIDEYIQIADYESESEDKYEFNIGKQLTSNLLNLKNPPTAIFCLNDMIAIGAMQEIERRKLDIPKDISIIGFDNLTISSMLSTPLTTIDQCAYEMGKMALNLVLNECNDKYTDIMLEPTLVIRKSTGSI